MFNVLKYFKEKRENEQLLTDFKKNESRIRIENYVKIMNNNIIPELLKSYKKQGLLPIPEQFFEQAHQKFCDAKKDGYLDDLNCIITPNYIEVANRIKELRLKEDWTIQKLADLSGYDEKFLINLENGEIQFPPASKLTHLSKIFNIDPKELLQLTGYIK